MWLTKHSVKQTNKSYLILLLRYQHIKYTQKKIIKKRIEIKYTFGRMYLLKGEKVKQSREIFAIFDLVCDKDTVPHCLSFDHRIRNNSENKLKCIFLYNITLILSNCIFITWPRHKCYWVIQLSLSRKHGKHGKPANLMGDNKRLQWYSRWSIIKTIWYNTKFMSY